MVGKQLKRYVIGPLSGGLNTNAEEGTLVSYQNSQGVPVELREHHNWAPKRRGGLSLPYGFRQTVTLPARVTGLHEFTRSNGVTVLLATAGSKLYSITETLYTELASGLELNAPIQIVTAYDKAVLCDGVNKLWQWDGTALTAIAASTEGAKASLFAQNRLWYFRADAETSLLYYSDPLDISTGYASNFVSCSPSDGEAITAIAQYFVPATLEPVIVVAKERSVGIVTGDGSEANPYTYMKVNTEVGVAGARQIVQFGQDIAYLTPKGVSSYKTDTVSGNLTHFYLSEKIRDQFLDLDASGLEGAIAWHDWQQSRLCFAVPLFGEADPSYLYCYDTELKAWYTEQWGTQKITALTVLQDGTVYHGNADGAVYLHQSGLAFGNEEIEPVLRTDFMDFGNSFNKKRLVELRVKFRTQSKLPYALQLHYNNGLMEGQQYKLDAVNTLPVWGEGVWTDDPDINVWASAGLQETKLYPSSWFDNVRFSLVKVADEQVLVDDAEGNVDDYAGLVDAGSGVSTAIRPNSPFALLSGYRDSIAQAITDCVGFLNRNRGNVKPNAINNDGLPYHVYENASQWLISPTATTSEGLSIFIRALVWAGEIAEAERVLALVEQKTFFNSINMPHWLVDLVGGTKTHAIRKGNYDGASYTATAGVFTIPAGFPHYGESLIQPTSNLGGAPVLGIQLVCDGSCEFLYDGYDLQPITGTGDTYAVDNYVTTGTGTVVTLEDNTVNGTVQVYYSYFDGATLPQYGLYMSYPALLRSYDPDNDIVENRIAADAALWIADAYWDVFQATGKAEYKTKFDALMQKLVDDQTLNGSYVTPFNSAQRGLHFSAIALYDEAGTRNPVLDLLNSSETNFSFGAASGAVNWTQGKPFYWETAYPMEVRLKGDGSGSTRWVLFDDGDGIRYRYPWLDSNTTDRVISFTKAACISWKNQYFDPSRKPFLTLYTSKNGGSSATLTTVTNYNPNFTDHQGVPFPVWNKLAYVHSGAGGYVIAGITKPSDTGSDGSGSVFITVGGSIAQTVEVRLTDDDSVTHSYSLNVTTTPTSHSIPWASFDGGAIAHPVQTVELLMPEGVTADLYIAGFCMGDREALASNDIDLIGFETRQSGAGNFSIIYARTKRTQYDDYDGAGVALFSLEYNILGLTGWRGPSYAGYQVPNPWVYHNLPDAVECLVFLRDAQLEYQKRYGVIGPFMPVFYRNLEENAQYGTIGTFGWDGPDPNTNWAGWQFRAISAVGEAYYSIFKTTGQKDEEAKFILKSFLNWVSQYLEDNDALPSDFRTDGTVETNYTSPDFWCLLGRACLNKLKVDDTDTIAYQLLERCVMELLEIQLKTGDKAGAFTYPSQLVYIFHQSEVMVTLGQLLAELDALITNATAATVEVFDIEALVQQGGVL